MKSHRLVALLTMIIPIIVSAQPQTWPQRGTHVDKWTNPDKSPFFWKVQQLKDITNLTEISTSFDSLGLTQRVTIYRCSTAGGPRFQLTGGSTRVDYDSGWPLSTNRTVPFPEPYWTTFEESFAQGIATRTYADGSSWFRIRTSDAVIRWHNYDTQHCSVVTGLTATVASIWRLPEQRDPPWLTLTKNSLSPGGEVIVPLPRRLGGFIFCMDFQSCMTCDGSACDRWEPLTVPPSMNQSSRSSGMGASPAGISMGAKGPKITILGITGDVFAIDRTSDLGGSWSHVGDLTIGEEAIGTWEDSEPVRGAAFYRVQAR